MPSPRSTILRSIFLSLGLVGALANSSFADGFLHTQGQDIVDESGNKIMLRGVGLGNWTLPEGYMWRFGNGGDRPRKIEKLITTLIGPDQAAKFWHEYRANYITEKDIARIAELGFNSCRPSLNARLFLTEGDNPVYVDEGFQLLDNLVAWCKQNHVYLIIDMHGAPGGQTGANIDDSPNDQPELFTNPEYEKRLTNLWVKFATRYKDEPTVAAYDLLNEPLPKRTGAADKYKDRLEPLYKRLTQAIRAVDKKHMLTVEGADWANDWSVFTTPFDSNMVYQFHYYCWSNPTNLNDISGYLDKRNRFNAPVWVGETGERDDAIYAATTDYFETNNIGWSFWPWKKMGSVNGPYSYKPPENWRDIQAYSEGGKQPSTEVAQKCFDDLLQNIRLENCTFSPDVISALFHRVPARVEAEDYGHKGPGKSYSVDVPTQNSKFYRKSEPVQIVPNEPPATAPATTNPNGGGGRRRGNSSQSIHLTAGEWTAYDLNSLEAKPYAITLRVKGNPGAVTVTVNDTIQKVDITSNGWTELKLQPAPFNKGPNQLKLTAESGTVNIDWISFQ